MDGMGGQKIAPLPAKWQNCAQRVGLPN